MSTRIPMVKPVVVSSSSKTYARDNTQYYNKIKLLEANKKSAASPLDIYIAEDLATGNGAKSFHLVPEFSKLSGFLRKLFTTKEKNDKHFYEIIPDDLNYKTFIFKDIDMALDTNKHGDIIKNPQQFVDKIIERNFFYFKTFLKQEFGVDYEPENGKNCQTSYCKIPEGQPAQKISIHIKYNIACMNWTHVGNIVIAYMNFLHTSPVVSKEDKKMFFFEKKQNNGMVDPTGMCIIDSSIYSNFRSIRLLYCSKRKEVGAGLQLVPYGRSSTKGVDHLIRVYEQNPQSNVIDIAHTHNHAAALKNAIPTNASKKLSKYPPRTTQLIPVRHQRECEGEADGEWRRTCRINLDVLKRVQHAIEQNTHVADMLGGIPNFESDQLRGPCQDYPDRYNFYVAPSSNLSCPYKGAPHSNNRFFFQYDHSKGEVKIMCFDDCCTQHRKSTSTHTFTVDSNEGSLLHRNQLENKNTLRCMDNIIQWNAIYNQDSMPDYHCPYLEDGSIDPDCPQIMCVKANMGVGKTRANKRLLSKINERNPNARIAVITHQQIISLKHLEDLKGLGFKCYMDIKREHFIDTNEHRKIIICLDSLDRLSSTDFDLVIIDEGLSMCMRLNSKFMDHSTVISKLHRVMLDSKKLMFLDACMDNFMLYSLVRKIEQERMCSAFWLKNEYIRPSNRKAQIIVNKKNAEDGALQAQAIAYILSLLIKGKRVSVSSSTKKFSEDLMKQFKDAGLDKTLRARMYNSESDRGERFSDCMNVNSVWVNYDLLVYSPSISSGVSFEKSHFDCHVAYCQNDDSVCAVDTTLQQLFRVRQLKEGEMTIFLNDSNAANENKRPIDPIRIHDYLSAKLNNIQQALSVYGDTSMSKNIHIPASTTVRPGIITYDTDKLGYTLLVGMISNLNKSRVYYAGILEQTLKNDYGIPVEVLDFSAESADKTRAREIKEKRDDQNIDHARFSKELFIDRSNYAHLENLTNKDPGCTNNTGIYTEQQPVQIVPFQTTDIIDIKTLSLVSVNPADDDAINGTKHTSKKLMTVEPIFVPYNKLIGQQMWTYKATKNLWNMNGVITAKCYDTFVGPYEQRDEKYELKKIYCRFTALLKNNIEDNEQKLTFSLEQIKDLDDYTFKIYNDKNIRSICKLIFGQKLMNHLFGGYRYQKEFDGNYAHIVTLKADTCMNIIHDYINTLTDATFKAIVYTFSSLSDKRYTDLDVVKKSQKMPANMVKHILKEAFCLDFYTPVNNPRKRILKSETWALLSMCVKNTDPDIPCFTPEDELSESTIEELLLDF